MSKHIWCAAIATVLSLFPTVFRGQDKPRGDAPHSDGRSAGTDLRVSDDGRNFLLRNGKPFFYLADTSWELFSRTTREEALRYLDDRQQKRFTVIQTAFLALAEVRTPTGTTVRTKPRPITTPHGFADAKPTTIGLMLISTEGSGGEWLPASPSRRSAATRAQESSGLRTLRPFLGERYGGSESHLDGRVTRRERSTHRPIPTGGGPRNRQGSGGNAITTRVLTSPCRTAFVVTVFTDDACSGQMIQSARPRHCELNMIAADYASSTQAVLDAEAT